MGRQRGSIIPRKGKRGISYSVKYRNPAGKQKWGGTFATKTKAQEKLNEILREMDAGTYVDRKRVTVEAFAKQWMDARIRLRGSTESGYRSIIKAQLVPRLGKVALCNLKVTHIQRAVADMLAEKVSVKTIHNCVTLLRSMLCGRHGASAMRLGFIGHDPTLGLELPTKQTKEIVPPTADQVWQLIEAAKEIGGISYPAVYLVAFTGLRRNEMLAGKYSDIDWLNSEFRVRRAVSKTKAEDDVHKWQWVIGPPKSRKSRRRVALPKTVLKTLSEMRQLAADPEGYIVPGAKGAFLDPDKFDAEVFAPVAARAGLALRFHDLRHFFASQLIAQGESALYVRDQMGHSSIQVTMDTYGHLFPQARPEASAKFEAAMAQAKQKRSGRNLVANGPENRVRDTEAN